MTTRMRDGGLARRQVDARRSNRRAEAGQAHQQKLHGKRFPFDPDRIHCGPQFCPIWEDEGMSKPRALMMAIILAGALALPLYAFAQAGYTGPRGPNTMWQNLETVGPGSQRGKADDQLIQEAKKRFADADPRVRVEGLEKLRYVDNATDSTE